MQSSKPDMKEYSHVLEFSLKTNADNYIEAGWDLIDTRMAMLGDEETTIYRVGWPHSAGEPADFPPKIDEVLPPRPPDIDDTK